MPVPVHQLCRVGPALTLAWLTLILVGAAACGGEPGPEPARADAASAGAPDGGPSGTDARGSTGDPSGPVILSFGTNVGAITQGESVVFTAVVTDPDGIDDLIGGALTSPDGATHYGAFQSTAQEGAYALVVSWDQLDQIDSISFNDHEDRIFRAEFFDIAGHRAEHDTTIRLTCGGDLACLGDCWDASTCKLQSYTPQSCDDLCTEAELTCVEECGEANYHDKTFALDSCATVPADMRDGRDFLVVWCCCLP